MPNIIDLNVLAPPDRQAKLDDETYSFPGDMPLEIYLRVIRWEERFQALEQTGDAEQAVELTEELADIVLELFQVKQPGMDALPPSMSLAHLRGLITTVYSSQEDPPAPPPNRAARRAAGTKSSSRNGKTKSGSSTRS